jgi:uncharacterized SAM-dependent methyltransferase
MHLQSTIEQEVTIADLNSGRVRAGETIHTEISRKFDAGDSRTTRRLWLYSTRTVDG